MVLFNATQRIVCFRLCFHGTGSTWIRSENRTGSASVYTGPFWNRSETDPKLDLLFAGLNLDPFRTGSRTVHVNVALVSCAANSRGALKGDLEKEKRIGLSEDTERSLGRGSAFLDVSFLRSALLSTHSLQAFANPGCPPQVFFF